MTNPRTMALALLMLMAAMTPVAALDELGKGLELPAHGLLMDRIRAADGTPDAFVTDGCSGGLSATWETVAASWPQFAADHQDNPPFEPCCVIHDRAYHDAGGAQTAEQSYAARLEADRALRTCVLETGASRRDELAARYAVDPLRVTQAYELIASGMYYAVRFGGGPCSGLAWRWGFGFDQCWSGN